MTKNIIVTGVTSGIGENAAKQLITAGYRVLGCGRRQEKLDELCEMLGENFIAQKADLRKKNEIAKVFAIASERFETLDVLVNNAGVGFESSLLDGNMDEWVEMFDINVLALAYCMRAAFDVMLPRNQGHIINISSLSAHRVTLGGGVYAASKHAVKALTEGARQELTSRGSAVRITAISPGFVETEFYDQYYQDFDEKAKKALFTQMKPLQAEDVVDALMYAISTPEHVGVNDILLRPLEQMS
jgi:17beta-estradiol 17-dehydrogenase / 3beta-hydroxysteroid 3-dehydrogenase